MPAIKKNSINNHKGDIKRSYYKKTTFEIKKEGIIKEHFIKKEKSKSEPNIFESTTDFYNKMNGIEDALLALIYKNNKITRQINQMKLIKIDEIKSLKTDSNILDKTKIYEELLSNYKDYNKTLENKMKLLIAEKENNSYITLLYKKINQILISINKNTKKMHNYENILLRLKNLLNKKKIVIKDSYIFEGIIIIEHFLSQLENDIYNNAKKTNEENIIGKIRYRIEKDKKMKIDRHKKEEIIRDLKLKKIMEKFNKICITSRKIPEKINFLKRNKSKKKNKSKDK